MDGSDDGAGVVQARDAGPGRTRFARARVQRRLSRGFRIAHGDYAGYVETQNSVGSTRTEVWFWVHLMACHEPTNAVFWSQELHWLIPGGRAVGGWAIKVDSPPKPVAEAVLSGFRRYGWPAMQAAMDSPGFPPPRQLGTHVSPSRRQRQG